MSNLKGSPIQNFYVPTEVTDYVDPLAKVYERQKSQDQKDLENKIEWSGQKEKADPGVTSLNTIKAIAQFSATAAASIASIKQSTKKNKEKKKTKVAQIIDSFLNKDQQETFVKQYEANYKEIQNESKAYRKTIDSMDWTGREDAYEFMKDHTPIKVLAIKESALVTSTQNAKAVFNNLAKTNQINLAELGNNTQNQFHNWFTNEYMEPLNPSREALGALVYGEYQRQNQTIKGTSQLGFISQSNTEEGQRFIDALNVGGITEDKNALTNTVNTEFTNLKTGFINKGYSPERAGIKAKGYMKGLVNVAINNGSFRQEHLTRLKLGNIKIDGKDKQGLDLLSSSDFTEFANNIATYNDHIVKQQQATGKVGITTTMAGIINKDTNPLTGQPYTRKDVDIAIQRAIDLGVSKDSKEIKAAENFNPTKQDQNHYTQEKKTTHLSFTRADQKTRKKIIENTDNNALKTEYIKLDEALTALEGDMKLDNGSYEEIAKQKFQTYTAGTVDITKGLTQNQGDMITLIENRFHEIKADVVSKAGPNATSDNLIPKINSQLNEWLTLRGWGEEPDSPNAGIFTKTVTGDFPGLELLNKGLSEIEGGSTPNLTYKEITNAFRRHGTLKKAIESGDLISNGEVAAIVTNKFNPITGDFEGWTNDWIIKSEITGASCSELLKFKLQQIINSNRPEDKYFTEAFNLKEALSQIETFEDPQIEVQKFIQKNSGILDAGNLIYKSERIHPVNWTESTYLQFAELEQKINPENYLQALKEEKLKRQEKEKKRLEDNPILDIEEGRRGQYQN